MNIKHTLKTVAALAATVLTSTKLASRVSDVSESMEVAFKAQARLDGVCGARSVSFGTVAVAKTFRKFFADDESSVLSALWAVAVTVDKSKNLVLADLRPPATPDIA